MGVGVMMPQKKQSGSPLGAIGTLVGAGVGSIIPGAGTAAGAGLGASIGGAAGGLAQGMQPQAAQPMGVQSPGSAMERRKAELDLKPLEQIRDSIDALAKTGDPALQQQYAKPLMEAEAMAKRQYGG